MSLSLLPLASRLSDSLPTGVLRQPPSSGTRVTVEGMERLADAIRVHEVQTWAATKEIHDGLSRLASSIEGIASQALTSYNHGLFDGFVLGVVALLAIRYVFSLVRK